MKILFCIDLEHSSDGLLHRAAVWAGRLDATLDLAFVDLYAGAWKRIGNAAIREAAAADAERIKAARAAELTTALTQVASSNRGDVIVLSGLPADAILAIHNAYDLILVGAHHRRPGEFFVGSVASRVARASTKPVLVLRRTPPRER